MQYGAKFQARVFLQVEAVVNDHDFANAVAFTQNSYLLHDTVGRARPESFAENSMAIHALIWA